MRLKIPVRLEWARCLGLIAVLLLLAAPAFAASQCQPQCGLGCPAACYADRTSSSFCSGGGGIQTACLDPRPSGFSTCEDQCPAGFYPTAGRSGVSQCSLGYSGYQTDCAALATAGTTLRTCETGCPDGYVPSRTFLNSSACRGRFTGVQTECTKVSGQSFDTCAACPTDYYPTSSVFDPDRCQTYGLHRTHCERVSGDPLFTCEDECPPNYVPIADSSPVPQCGGAYQQIQTRCKKITGDTLATCETGCPDGFYPTSTRTNLQCAVRFSRLETVCARVQGPTLTSCGIGCPTGYFLERTVTNLSCGTVYGNLASVCSRVNPQGPVITLQPQSVTITEGQSTTLKVQATGQAPLSYQWYIGTSGDRNQLIAGATGTSVNVHPTMTTSYWVLVKNNHGEVASDTATVTVNPACVNPQITIQPQSVQVESGQTAHLEVTATGTSLQYRWYQGTPPDTSSPVPNGTQRMVDVTPLVTTGYWVQVTGCNRSVNSVPVTVTVTTCDPPIITHQPQPATIEEGQAAILSVAVSGTQPTYQWYQGHRGDTSHPVQGGTAASIQVRPSADTFYWVRATNRCGQVDSDMVLVTVEPACVPLAIAAQPQPVRIEEGQSTILSVTLASGTQPVFQWYEGATGDVSRPVGGNSSQLVVSPPETTRFWVRITNRCSTVDSDSAEVTVEPGCRPPAFTVQPVSVSIEDGETATLHVEVLGTAPLIQWYEGPGTTFPVTGGTDLTLVVAPHDTTSYHARATNNCGSAASNLATVTVSSTCVPPAITQAPQSVRINPGQTATLQVVASGTSPSYQWYQGARGDVSQPVPSGTGPSVNVAPTATTSYWVRISNRCGVADSDAVEVTVEPICVPPAITAQPRSTTIELGQSATLVASASGTTPSYQWYQGFQGDVSHPVPGGIGSTLVVSPASTTSYWLFVQNGCGSTSSVAATVTVNEPCDPPRIDGQPQSVTIEPGQVATLSVDAAGATGYQWYQGTTGDTSSPVPGGGASSLLVSPASTASYWVRVFGSCDFADSNTATVTVHGCGPDGTACGGDGNHTCQGGQCVCSNCGSPVCCGAPGNSYCDGQQIFDPNTGYTGACTSMLPGCSAANDFSGDDEVYYNGDILACVKYNGEHQWFPRRPSPRCQEVSPVCGYLCAYNFGGGMGFQCEDNGVWSQNPPLPYCFGGTIPESFLCQ